MLLVTTCLLLKSWKHKTAFPCDVLSFFSCHQGTPCSTGMTDMFARKIFLFVNRLFYRSGCPLNRLEVNHCKNKCQCVMEIFLLCQRVIKANFSGVTTTAMKVAQERHKFGNWPGNKYLFFRQMNSCWHLILRQDRCVESIFEQKQIADLSPWCPAPSGFLSFIIWCSAKSVLLCNVKPSILKPAKNIWNKKVVPPRCFYCFPPNISPCWRSSAFFNTSSFPKTLW